MSITRKFLSAMGIEGDKVDEIINAHVETVDALKEERDEAKAEADKYKADAEKLASVQKELDGLKEEAAKGTADPWEPKYTALQKEFEDYKADIAAKETKAKKASAYKAILKSAGVDEKRLDSIMKVTDIDGYELDEKDGLKDADKVAEQIKKEWADFIPSEGTEGAKTATPPASNGGSTQQLSRAAQLAAQYHANLYGTAKEG